MRITERIGSAVTAATIGRMVFPLLQWIIQGVFNIGLHILVAPEHSGKSYLALCFALAVTTDLKWEETSSDLVGEALYISYEPSTRDIQKRLSQYLEDIPSPERLHFHFSWPIMDDSGIEALQEWLVSHPDTKLVVIDNLVDFTGGQFNSQYAGQAEILGRLRSLALDKEIAIVALHHPPKGKKRNPSGHYYGSRAIGGKADTLLDLKTDDVKKEGILEVKGNNIPKKIFNVAWNDEGPWHITSEDDATLERIRVTPEKLEILRIFAGHESLKPCEVTPLIKREVTDSSVRTEVRALWRDDCLDNVAYGHYCLSEQGKRLLKRYPLPDNSQDVEDETSPDLSEGDQSEDETARKSLASLDSSDETDRPDHECEVKDGSEANNEIL